MEVSYYKLGKGNMVMCMKLKDVCMGLIIDIIMCLDEKVKKVYIDIKLV